jgi:hypothetical protein
MQFAQELGTTRWGRDVVKQAVAENAVNRSVSQRQSRGIALDEVGMVRPVGCPVAADGQHLMGDVHLDQGAILVQERCNKPTGSRWDIEHRAAIVQFRKNGCHGPLLAAIDFFSAARLEASRVFFRNRSVLETLMVLCGCRHKLVIVLGRLF